MFFILVFTLKYSEESDEKSSHSIYVKKYRSEKKSARKPIGKTIVALNIPPYANEKSISNVFSIFGEVQNVILIDSFANEHKTKYELPSKYFKLKLPFKFLIAFVIFKKSSSVDILFNQKTDLTLPPLSSDKEPLLTGVAKWTAEYNSRSIDTEEMQKEIDEYMLHYDKIKRAEEINGEDEADDDGWVTVGKKGHYAGFKQNETVVSKLEQKIEAQKKNAKQMLKSNYKRASGIYSFQFKEGKKQELLELRKKFQDDKAKLQAVRTSRKFKPY